MFFRASLINIIIWLVLALLLVGGVFIYWQSAEAQAVQYEFTGWLWSARYGWISLSAENCEVIYNQDSGVVECQPNGVGGERINYGVVLDGENNLSGYGWSSAVGWVCFGSSCSDVTPDGGSSSASLNESNPDLEPSKPNHGVQMCAGIISISSDIFFSPSVTSIMLLPKIGRPS